MVDLASDESGQISYSLIKDTLQVNMNAHIPATLCPQQVFFAKTIVTGSLQIDYDEVEPRVVKAITAKLIDCKIDQMNQVIQVRWVQTFSNLFSFCQEVAKLDGWVCGQITKYVFRGRSALSWVYLRYFFV